MSDKPDFEALRKERNLRVLERIENLAREHGVKPSDVQTSFDPNSCYCACTGGGPCEHDWSGSIVDYGSVSTSTCARCGASAFSHDMRTAP